MSQTPINPTFQIINEDGFAEPIPDALPLWEQQPDEPAKLYAWFHIFLMLGPSRSISAAYNAVQNAKTGKKAMEVDGSRVQSQTWTDAARNWHWGARARAWDAEQRRLDEAAKVAARAELADREFKTRQDMMDKIEKMLEFPIHQIEHVEEDGKTVTIVNPARWDFNTVARLLLAQAKLGQMAQKSEQSELSIGWKNAGNKDMTATLAVRTMTDAELEAIAAQGNPNSPQTER
jgi:hypothetical protein